jgi:hypothetical protein
VAITDDDRDHLFETLHHQYDPQDARTLIAMLGSTDPQRSATKEDLRDAAEGLRTELKADIADLRIELKTDIADVRAELGDLRVEMRSELAAVRLELREVMQEQTRTYIAWMFGLLTAYTAMAGFFVAVAMILQPA